LASDLVVQVEGVHQLGAEARQLRVAPVNSFQLGVNQRAHL
jgi:hypothetical protein